MGFVVCIPGKDITESLVSRADTPAIVHRLKRGINDNSVVTAFDDVSNIDVDLSAQPPAVSNYGFTYYGVK